MNQRPKITVIFLLYSEEKYVPGLFESILAQRHPEYPELGQQSLWMNVMFVDNGSKDGTLAALEDGIRRAGSPSNYRIVHNPQNIGISRALNKAFGLVETPFAVTCHCDVLFGRPDYVARMAELLEKNPSAGAIAGQPAIPKKDRIPFAEKVNLVANLMDIFPAHSGVSQESRLVPVGFVEGRCDAFRIDALRAAGFYDTTLRLAGEDQVLAARMRGAGYELYQAPDMPYSLSVSSDQDSLAKLVRHQRLFGRAHPYIVLMNKKAVSGIVGESAGANRQARTILRISQLASSLAYLLALFFLLQGDWLAAGMILAAAVLGKHLVFGRHIRAVGFSLAELARFYVFQPLLDLSYSMGLLHGLWLLGKGTRAKTIS